MEKEVIEYIQKVGKSALATLKGRTNDPTANKLYRAFIDSCELNGEDPIIVMGSMMENMIRNPNFAEEVISMPIDLTELEIVDISEADIREIEKMKQVMYKIRPLDAVIERAVMKIISGEDESGKISDIIKAVATEEKPKEDVVDISQLSVEELEAIKRDVDEIIKKKKSIPELTEEDIEEIKKKAELLAMSAEEEEEEEEEEVEEEEPVEEEEEEPEEVEEEETGEEENEISEEDRKRIEEYARLMKDISALGGERVAKNRR